MLELLWLVPAVPLAGFLILAILGARLSRGAVAAIACASVGIATIMAALVSATFIIDPPAGRSYSQTLWTWMQVGNFVPSITFYLDALSVVMILVVTFVAFLIHLYSAEYMLDEDGYSRFFAYMNLFVASMLILVLADNLLLLYLGWEGVGLCSYLLIGFWYKDTANIKAAIKAFVVTRIGDMAMAVGIFLLFTNFGSLQIQQLMRQVSMYPAGSAICIAAAALLLGGALGKSAQLPLQTWLPDAMAGPAPVSALIHAATMVTAGVYLIARTHVLFAQAPIVQLIVAIIGAVTLLLAGFSALTQWDIKRVLAYSTISQVGYMFLALGVGAWSAAIFHFMVHAFFKSLLFLAAGVVIIAVGNEHNIFKMGGLRRKLPLTFSTFLIGSASLSAIPLVTAGFYSKDMILWQVWTSQTGGFWLWSAGLLGALITAIYAFRVVFVVFFGEMKIAAAHLPAFLIKFVLIILAVLSMIAGFINLPSLFGHVRILSEFLQSALPVLKSTESQKEYITQIAPAFVSLIGIYFAYLLFFKKSRIVDSFVATGIGSSLHWLAFHNWGFDWVYNKLFVQPYFWIAKVNRDDFIDLFYDLIARVSEISHRILARTQTGKVRWYATGIAIGAILFLAIVIFL
jgi:NADH-quinone oxidoreductase subunit L